MSDTETDTDSEQVTPHPQDTMNQTQQPYKMHSPTQRNPYSSHSHRHQLKRKHKTTEKPKSKHYQSQQSLQTWLHFARQGQSTDNRKDLPHQPLRNDEDNEDPIDSEHWGDPITKEKAPGTIRVLLCNVDMLSIGDECLAWEAAVQALQEYQVDVASFQETNVNWNPAILQRIRQILLKASPQ